jgi:CheY-like chemotaxis protein
MAIEYKILWFEDDAEIVSENAEVLREFLADNGFQLRINHQENGLHLENHIGEDYDLILTDLNLSEEDTGDRIIAKLRDHSILTEVLFYSSNASGINDIITKHKWVERVSFLVGAKELQNKVRQLVTLTIKKLQEANTVRGLVLSETSELDVTMTEIILDLFKSFDDGDKKKHELIEKTVKNREQRLKGLVATSNINNIEELCGKLESGDRLNAITRLIKHKHRELGEGRFSGNEEVLTKYKEEVLDVRNALAHSKETIIDGKKQIISHINDVQITFDDATCVKIRRDLTKHSNNLSELKLKINGLIAGLQP